MQMKTNRGELAENQAARNAANAERCLVMITESTAHDGYFIRCAVDNLHRANYLDALEFAKRISPRGDANLCPHPLIVAIAEIRNAIRYSEQST